MVKKFEKSVLEKTVKVAVKKRLKQLGVYAFWPVPMGLGDVTLDCLVCYQGNFIGIECKRPGEKLTPQQRISKEKIETAGGIVLIIDSEEKAYGISSHHLKGE